MAGGSLSKCQSPPPVTNQTRTTVCPDIPDPAEVITEVNSIIFVVGKRQWSNYEGSGPFDPVPYRFLFHLQCFYYVKIKKKTKLF